MTLISSVLSSLPLFYLSFFRMPQGILNSCNKIMRSFLWGGVEGNKRVAWIKLEKVCKPKALGGLGLREWDIFNKALLGKWWWRLLVETESIWVKVLRAKYVIPTLFDNLDQRGKM